MAEGDTIEASIVRMGLAAPGEAFTLTPLSGGVSSDIYRVDLAGGAVCVKRALARLKVAAQWLAPVERNRYEAAWLRFANDACAGCAPRVIAEDARALAFAMPFLAPQDHPTWKSQLRDGRVDPKFAASVGRVLGTIHAASADRGDLARQFATDESFHAIRLEPYLVATARAHAGCAAELKRLVDRTASTRRVLVHGDVSPKNILCGPGGPVLIDAECAWFGDPAFDLAFCLNHLLLKSVWRPAHHRGYQACYAALADAYAALVRWEPAHQVLVRAAALLPALLLARIDGKSPVEYVANPGNKALVREFALGAIGASLSLPALGARWSSHLESRPPVPEP
ncbi:MAG: phosphotransferase [Burkholderiaceae bacterium]|nr:phosphotransferase [Burkholderiaceae bacterium]